MAVIAFSQFPQKLALFVCDWLKDGASEQKKGGATFDEGL